MSMAEEYISWNDMSEDEKAKFFQREPFKLIPVSKRVGKL